MTIGETIDEFILECQIKRYSPRTLKSYRNNLNHFFENKRSTQLAEVSSMTIRARISEYQAAGLKSTYLNSVIKVLRAFYVFVTEQEYIAANPMNKVSWCKEKIPVIKAFTNDVARRMIAAYSEKEYLELRNKTIMAMLFDTGIRCFELCCLNNLSISENYMTIVGKGNKERIAAISPPLRRLLVKYNRVKANYFSDKKVPDNLFLSRTGKMLTIEAVERIVRHAGEAADIDNSIRCSPHTCRHYFAQAQIRNGCDIYTLSKLLGHTNIKITQVYLNSMQDNDLMQKALITSPLVNM